MLSQDDLNKEKVCGVGRGQDEAGDEPSKQGSQFLSLS